MIYFLLVDRFADGNAANDLGIDLADPQALHGGDLAGVTAHLDELSALGVDTLWLGPIADMRDTPFYGFGAFHGYWTENLDRLEPRFGVEADLARLVEAMRRRKMGLVLDMVYNHVAPDHPWVSERPAWFHGQGPIVNWGDAEEARTHDVHGLPDLAQENPEVYEYLRAASFGWLHRAHPVAFRLDAVRHLDPEFLTRIGADVRARTSSKFQLWGEVFDGNVATVLDTREQAHLDSVFDFPLHYALREVVCDDRPAAAIAAALDRGAGVPSDAWITFLDNHDTSRITTACHDDARRVDLALSLLFTLRGRPMITWGTEWGATGAGEPDNRADMRWSGATPAEEAAHQARLSHLRTLAGARRVTPALAKGNGRTIGLGEHWFVVERRAEGSVRWVGFNGGTEAVIFEGVELPGRQVKVVDPLALGVEAPRIRAGWTTIEVSNPPVLAAGDSLRLVGSAAALGDWDPARGVAVPGKVKLPAGAATFKLVVAHADGTATWAPGGNQWMLGAEKKVGVRWE